VAVSEAPLDVNAPNYRQQFEGRLALEGSGRYMGVETFPMIVEALGTIIKDDEYSVKQTYLHTLSAYVEAANLQSLAPTSEGKTYVIVNTTSVFPKSDVWPLGGLSPTALVHQRGTLVDRDSREPIEEKINELQDSRNEAKFIEDKAERQTALRKIDREIREVLQNSENEINLENIIITFLDKPHYQTMEALKPLLSHDSFETTYKFTNRSQKLGLAAETTRLKGWPVALVASTKTAANDDTWAEIVSRFDTIQPNMTPQKYRAAVELTAQRKGIPQVAQNAILGLDKLEEARDITEKIIEELKQIKAINKTERAPVPNLFWVPFYEQLGRDLPAEVGRHMRDSNRFFTILQMHAAANVFNRPRLIIDGKPSIIVTRRDYHAAKELYFSGDRGESLMSGIPERVLNWFDVVFMPCWARVQQDWIDRCEEAGQTALDEGNRNVDFGGPPVWVTTAMLTDQTKNAWTQTLTTDHIRKNYLAELEKAGYVDVQDHPTDKRAKHYRPLVENNTRKKRYLDDSAIFCLDSLREALEQLKNIVESEGGILIEKYDGAPMTVEELYRRYYTDG